MASATNAAVVGRGPVGSSRLASRGGSPRPGAGVGRGRLASVHDGRGGGGPDRRGDRRRPRAFGAGLAAGGDVVSREGRLHARPSTAGLRSNPRPPHARPLFFGYGRAAGRGPAVTRREWSREGDRQPSSPPWPGEGLDDLAPFTALGDEELGHGDGGPVPRSCGPCWAALDESQAVRSGEETLPTCPLDVVSSSCRR